MHANLAHWDDVPSRRRDYGTIRGSWTDLASAVGSVRVGLKRIAVDAGHRSTPAHRHGAEEEIFWVLGGRGLSWQDGRTHVVRAGDCLVHLAEAEAHTLVAGPEGLDVLTFGERVPVEACHLPRAGVMWLGTTWAADAEAGGHPYEREAAAGELDLPAPSPRPGGIVHVDEVEPRAVAHGRHALTVRDLGRAGGSQRTGLRHLVIEPGRYGYPLHCHAADEELFVVLAGSGAVELGDERHPVRAGQVLARPAATRVAHAFRAGDEGLTLLAYGTREPNDVAWYPRSGKVALRGIGLVTRVEQLGYWDGEE